MAFASANIWFAAARSTIPLELHGNITQTERLIEKTPGIDDVYIVTLDLDRRIQVDSPVFDAVAAHQSVNKRAWSQTIEIDGKRIDLAWSSDFRGMLWAMPLTVAACVLLGMIAVGRRLRDTDESSDARETSAQSALKSQSAPRSP